MKVSLNWLRQYLYTSLEAEAIAELLTSIGLEVEGMQTHETVKGGLAGLVIGEVLTKTKHPNADKLSITTVNVGQEQPLQIVCGAANVAAGQKVVVATENTKLYPSQGEPFVIKKGKIRGEISEGMICAEDEIGLGASHEGIMVLDPTAVVGSAAKDYFGIETDTIIEIGLTPNRSDAMSQLGVAFDLFAAIKVQGLDPQAQFEKPQASSLELSSPSLPIAVTVEDEQACPRYSGLVLDGLTIQPSPSWLQNRLRALGLEPINNVVDVTNFVLHELGQPLHAFDYHKIPQQTVRVKKLPQGTSFVSLDGQKRSLHAEDLCICGGDDSPMCLAGVFGGLDSGVSEQTQAIFLESAHFHPGTTRRSSFRHGLRTEAAACFEKGTDPNATVFALQRAAALIVEVAGGRLASTTVDLYPQPVARKQVKVRYAQIKRLLGLEIPKADLQSLCQALDFEWLGEEEQGFIVSIPTNKIDVTREADVLEEFLRIYGYNRVETPSTVQSVLSFQDKPQAYTVRHQLANWLAGAGFMEMMGLSMIQDKYAKELYAAEQLVYINNTANQHLNLMRPSLLFNGLEAIVHNQNRQRENLRLFEWGKIYYKKPEGGYGESEQLALFLTGSSEANWLQPKAESSNFYQLKSYVQAILALAGFEETQWQSQTVENEGQWSYALVWSKGKEVIARLGKVHAQVLRKMEVKNPVYYAEISLKSILEQLKKHKIKTQSLAKFPVVRRDLAMVVSQQVQFEQIAQLARKQGKRLLKGINLFDVYENESQLGSGKKSYALSFFFQDEQKTLQEKDIDQLMQGIMNACEQGLEAQIRKS